MTEAEKKALALLNEVAKEMGLEKVSSLELDMPGERALLRAIEQHEAFRQAVSEFALGVKGYMASVKAMAWQSDCDEFIIAKPDPLVEAMNESLDRLGAFDAEEANNLRAALAARGLEIREKQS